MIVAIIATIMATILMGSAIAGDRPKIGVALAGGGARGAAHIGVLKALHEMGIPIDYIAGTSMGAIIGGLYATGKSPAELEKILSEIDWKNVFTDKPPRKQMNTRRKLDDTLFLVDKLPGIKDGKLKLPPGIFQGQKFYGLIKDLTRSAYAPKNFDGYTPSFRAVATDLETGDPVILDQGDLATAIRASMSIPAFFAPVDLDGKLLVDGGLSNNLPISVVRDMGADIIIAIDIGSPLASREQLDNVLTVATQLSNFLTRFNTLAQIDTLEPSDILIVPDLSEIGSADFDKSAAAINLGYVQALRHHEELQELAVTVGEYDEYLARRNPEAQQIIVEFIDVRTGNGISEALIRKNILHPLNQALDVDLMNDTLGNINGLGYFESVFYDITERDGMSGVVINARPRSWGPRYIQFGGQYSNNLEGTDALDLRFGYLVAPRGPAGDEWSTILSLGEDTGLFSEYYRPFKPESSLFYSLAAFGGRVRYNTFADGELIAQSDIERIGASVRLGLQLGNAGETLIGYRLYTGEQEEKIGARRNTKNDIEGGEIFWKNTYDTLDDVGFPTSGFVARLDALRSDEDIGALSDFGQYALDYYGAYSTTGLTFLGGVRLQMTTSGIAPLQNRFRLGGLFELGGSTTTKSPARMCFCFALQSPGGSANYWARTSGPEQ